MQVFIKPAGRFATCRVKGFDELRLLDDDEKVRTITPFG
jgi:hypothetical protein